MTVPMLQTLCITAVSICQRDATHKLLNGDFRFTKGFIIACLHFLLVSAAAERLSALSTAPIPDTAQQKVQRRKPQGGQLARGSISDPAEPLRQPCQMVSKFWRLYLGAYKQGRRVH